MFFFTALHSNVLVLCGRASPCRVSTHHAVSAMPVLTETGITETQAWALHSERRQLLYRELSQVGSSSCGWPGLWFSTDLSDWISRCFMCPVRLSFPASGTHEHTRARTTVVSCHPQRGIVVAGVKRSVRLHRNGRGVLAVFAVTPRKMVDDQEYRVLGLAQSSVSLSLTQFHIKYRL